MSVIRESQVIKVKIEKRIEIAKDSYSLILKCSKGRKYLLDENNYKYYDLRLGQNIDCRVDKVNCSGRIYLEPLHPHYNENEIYSFEIDSISEIKNDLDDTRYIVNIRDVFDNNLKIVYCLKPDLKVGKSVDCQILSLNKGKVKLNPIAGENQTLKIEEYYYFNIIGEVFNKKNEECFILKDKFSCNHLLPKENYKPYHFKIGDKIRCRIVRVDKYGNFKLEPDHPYYTIGEKYYFKFHSIQTKYDELKEPRSVIVVKDILGLDAWIAQYPDDFIKVNDNDKLPCVLERISNGRLYLVAEFN